MSPTTLKSLLTLALTAIAFPSVSQAQTAGPENGTLVIVGGGTIADSIFERIIEFAGGPDSPIVTIPTADGGPEYDQNAASAAIFRRLGATNVTVLHTYDPKVADTDEFIAPLLEARGVWFGGGRQWRLVDAYAGTKTEAAFHDVLARGGVVGGSSAGASIIGSFLARGDTQTNEVIIGDHIVGFGFLQNAAIDQHVLVRNRMFDMADVLKLRPELWGVACDEGTAFIVANRTDAVLDGRSYCVIHDGGFWSREEGSAGPVDPDPTEVFYLVRAGDRYDLATRKVVE
ncbi:hypothetical protein HYALB_00005267 [Hymenoscyphus albidus]|uniref:Cyanophycinase n=1 Tax=Hymenoscyphus albidus TaxID=595503 RepID=A0A9N9L9C9_9HELO|nr:hypothetical protein HYALB_00005267 [Hymenoscyphus albidus]